MTVTATSSASSGSSTRRVDGSAQRYVVRTGDTLESIARAHGISREALLAANPRVPQGSLPPGLSLTLPAAAPAGEPGWHAPPVTVREPAVGSAIRPGDEGRRLAAAGAQALERNQRAHLDSIEKTGVGRYYGVKSAFQNMTADERANWLREYANEGASPAMPKSSSCIDWAFENLRQAYRVAGKEARWKQIQAEVGARGSRGTDLAKELQKDGWEAVYWNPDTRNPVDGLPEHSFSAKKVAQGLGYYGIAVDHQAINFRPTPEKGTRLDLSGLSKLERVPFFFGIARGGSHTFLGRNGKVNEFHWDQMPNSTHVIEEKPLKDWGWNSGLIMVPPGTWPSTHS